MCFKNYSPAGLSLLPFYLGNCKIRELQKRAARALGESVVLLSLFRSFKCPDSN